MPCQLIYSQTKTTETKTYELWIVCVNCTVKEALPAVWTISACLCNVCWIRKISCGPYGRLTFDPERNQRGGDLGNGPVMSSDTFSYQDNNCGSKYEDLWDSCHSGVLWSSYLIRGSLYPEHIHGIPLTQPRPTLESKFKRLCQISAIGLQLAV